MLFNKYLKTALVLFAFLSFQKANAWVQLPAIFSDGMVLQQQSADAFWGWANPGEKVYIGGSWDKKMFVTTADPSGHWTINLPAPAAGGPFNITIAAENTIVIKDVLIGEVWVASGQSNMGFTMKSDADSKTEIPAADFPQIRYLYVERQYGLNKFADVPGSKWKTATPKTVPDFSAVAFYFAKKIQAEKHVPVGIIFSAWGGTPAEAWTPRNVLTQDTVLTHNIDRWQFIQDNVGKDSVIYQKQLASWKKDSVGKMPEEPKDFYYYKRPWREPSVLFNGMIDPIIPFGVKGVLWYQGESNVGYSTEYYDLFSKMITSWRMRWGRPDMPFYFVQISAFGYEDLQAGAEVREAQYQVMKNIPNTAMAVSIDKGNMKDIHYTHKAEIGKRLALIALAKNYGESNLNFRGPELKTATIKNNKIILDFQTSSGLMVNGKSPFFEVGFQEKNSDKIDFKTISGVVEGNTIILPIDKNSNAVVVRYAWLLPGEANIFDKEGLPAFPFSVDIKK